MLSDCDHDQKAQHTVLRLHTFSNNWFAYLQQYKPFPLAVPCWMRHLERHWPFICTATKPKVYKCVLAQERKVWRRTLKKTPLPERPQDRLHELSDLKVPARIAEWFESGKCAVWPLEHIGRELTRENCVWWNGNAYIKPSAIQQLAMLIIEHERTPIETYRRWHKQLATDERIRDAMAWFVNRVQKRVWYPKPRTPHGSRHIQVPPCIEILFTKLKTGFLKHE